jgi:hypothetical protein
MIWTWWNLGRALNTSLIWICLGAICLFVPLLSLLVLVWLNGTATNALQRAGIKVGLMGANLRKLAGSTGETT